MIPVELYKRVMLHLGRVGRTNTEFSDDKKAMRDII